MVQQPPSLSLTAAIIGSLFVPLSYVALLPFGYLVNLPVTGLLVAFNFAYAMSVLSSGRVDRQRLPALVAVVLMSGVFLLSSANARELGISALKPVAQLFLVLGYFNFVQSAASVHCKHVSRLVPIFTLVLLVPAIGVLIYVARGLGHDDPDSFWTRSKNSVGALSLSLTLLNFALWKIARANHLKGRSARYALIASLACVLLCGSRGTQLAILAIAAAYSAWNKVKPKSALLIATLAIIPLFIYVYVNLQSLANVPLLEDRVRDITGANLYSGRQLIWPSIIEAVQKYSPMFGLGPTAHASDAMAINGIVRTWSAHDLYLQIYLQGGWLGCIALLLFIVCIWRQLYKVSRTEFQQRLACTAFIGCLIYDIFEVSLLQNSLSTGLVLWLTLGLISSPVSVAEAPLDMKRRTRWDISRRRLAGFSDDRSSGFPINADVAGCALKNAG